MLNRKKSNVQSWGALKNNGDLVTIESTGRSYWQSIEVAIGTIPDTTTKILSNMFNINKKSIYQHDVH